MSLPTLRPAQASDAGAICAIYNHYVTTTAISFEEDAVPAASMAQRIADVHEAGLPWLVLEIDGRVVGYAYATKWRVRPAYRHSVESSIYLDKDVLGRGLALGLYRALLDALRAGGLHRVIAGIALPNAASVGIHQKLGFCKVAHFSEVGRKFGRWMDVGYWELGLDKA